MAAGCATHLCFERDSGWSGLPIFAGLSLLAGAVAFGVAYPLADYYVSLDSTQLLVCTSSAVAAMIMTSSVMKWLGQ